MQPEQPPEPQATSASDDTQKQNTVGESNPKKRSNGRPTRLTEETVKALTTAIQRGATQKLACLAAGVAEATFYQWLADAEKPGAKQSYIDLSESIKKATGMRAVRWLKQIDDAAESGNWTAAAWKLERIHPDDFGLRPRRDLLQEQAQAASSKDNDPTYNLWQEAAAKARAGLLSRQEAQPAQPESDNGTTERGQGEYE